MSGKRIAVLGLAFKARTDDVRDSPALTIVPVLRREGAIIMAYDPVANGNAKAFIGNGAVHYAATLSDALKEVDGAVIITEWDEFRNDDWRSLALTMANPLLIDLRNLFSFQEASSFGIKYVSLGREPVAISRRQASSIGIKHLSLGESHRHFMLRELDYARTCSRRSWIFGLPPLRQAGRARA